MASDEADGAGTCDVTDNGLSADVVEQRGGRRRLPGLDYPVPRWRPARGAAALAAVALLAGLAAGYAAGVARVGSPRVPERPAAAGPSAPTPLVGTFTPALVQDVSACSIQEGQDLQLGVQVTNQSGVPVTLRGIKAEVPLGGLKPVAAQWTPCGAFPAASVLPGDGLLGQGDGNPLVPGASTWFTVTFRVLMACPEALPVQFSVGYVMNGHAATVSLPGFPDLGQVAYRGCARR
jgi:hypothetical protein